MSNVRKDESSPQSAPESPVAQRARAPYEAPRIERRIPVLSHTLQGGQTSGTQSVFGT